MTASDTTPCEPPPQGHAAVAREQKRARAEAAGIDDAFVSRLVDQFYSKVQEDDCLAPIFAERVEEWPEHLGRMKAFWRSVLFNSGEFSGNPMVKHMIIPGLDKTHFARWLELFYATLHDLAPPPEGAALVAERARMIAESLMAGRAMRREGLAGLNAGKDLPRA